jgi:RecB family exonuclease
MKHLWGDLKGSHALQQDTSPSIERAAAAAVRELELEEPFAGMERKRLAKLAREWLDVERERPAFTVEKIEEKAKLPVASLQLNGRIDRMDKLESGGHALIDYKSGRPSPNEWTGARPDDPQLPLYALSAKEEVTAVAFAKLKTGEMRFMGFSRGKQAIPQVGQSLDWAAHLAGWKKEVEALGAGFAAGDARVDPKDGLSTCRYCDLQTLCRVFEKINNLSEEEAEE